MEFRKNDDGTFRSLTMNQAKIQSRGLKAFTEFIATNKLHYDDAITLLPYPQHLQILNKAVYMRTLNGVEAVSELLDKVKQKYGVKKLCLAGESAAGVVVAGLVFRRNDIGCAVMAATPFAKKQWEESREIEGYFTGEREFYNHYG